ncbi:hypothetical protein OG864_45510 [Streptomyces sp. NBC_00124]|uniref:hypothetical protein n=1 Tax=Streptomyces sp. NBC_00124 TaxID=2975662 RepID=UPI00224FAA39|nr:hypothetical protein [Streptomyces sp. NBC_00124]MCX5365962.1 hypothetical protein [Streptomyces sp. NBC_00124]
MSLSRGFAYAAAVCWGFVLLGATAVALGDPGGLTPIFGAGVPALVFTTGACIERHTSRRYP